VLTLNLRIFPRIATNCRTMHQQSAEGMGLEPTTPLLGHHISSVAASHSLTLRTVDLTSYRNAFSVDFNVYCSSGGTGIVT
jgi:hypothetical protein